MITLVSPSDTSLEKLESELELLSSRKQAWVETPVRKRIHYLETAATAADRVWDRWVEASCRAKGLDPYSPLAGEEWLLGPALIARCIRLYREALVAGGQPRLPSLTTRPNGQPVARVFPGTVLERMMYLGMSADVWLDPSTGATQGAVYRDGAGPGRICLVLGGGNVSAIPPTDVLHKLLAENQVVLLKMNPVNAYLGPLLEEIFYPLVRDGFLRVIYGGVEVGEKACHHPLVDTVHITGSQHSHDAIVWGSSAAERKRRQKQGKPFLEKTITSELGCVTPILVVPGPWTETELAYQARHAAGMISSNAGCNCVAGQLLVTSSGWSRRERFLTHVRRNLERLPDRKAYYPGAHGRYRQFVERYRQAEPLSRPPETCLPWTLISGIPPQDGEYGLENEAFCGLLTETSLESSDAAQFLARATEFLNHSVWGDLSCVILLHPETEAAHRRSLETALEDLRYSTIGINLWGGIGFGLMVTPWGGAPGNTLENPGSGLGFVHNTFLLDRPVKTILRAPFKTPYVPPWFPNNRNLREVGQRVTEFETGPSFKSLARALVAVLKSGPA
ncbi:MAG: aldehyde dehydrogenase family protein [Armatimonadetes bacterium]|nr:aldehyde dehydrogenase family protein [Armatimonadota bacterium]